MAAANGFGRVLVGQRRPALDAGRLQRDPQARKAFGGIILSASHNPGGPTATSASSTTSATAARRPRRSPRRSSRAPRRSTEYRILDAPDLDLDRLGTQQLGDMTVEVIDPVADYAELMADAVRLPRDPRAVRRRLPHALRRHARRHRPLRHGDPREATSAPPRAPSSTARRCPTSAATTPTPTSSTPRTLYDLMMGAGRARLRRRLGRRRRPQPDHRPRHLHHPLRQPGDARRQRPPRARLRRGPRGHRPLDADQRAPPTGSRRSSASACYETPTGWKFFGNLLDAGMATICGEESAGTGSNHVREKDGLWAVLLWLNILAARKQPAQGDRPRRTGSDYGRNYYSRHDYEEIDTAAANGLMDALRAQLADAARRQRRRPAPSPTADDFAYTRPGRRLGQRAPGHPHPVRGRLARRLPPLRHRHRRRHAARLHRALRARPEPPRPWRPQTPSPT